MTDIQKPIQRRSALKQAPSGAPTISTDALSMTEHRPHVIVQINGATEPATLQIALSAIGFPAAQFKSGRAYCCDDATLLWNGPGMWILVCENDRADLVNQLNVALQDTAATVTDLSHSRTILTMQGENLLDFLYSGCPIDLDNCPPDACFSTQFGHFNIMLHLKDRQHANMYVYRSFGQALWEHCQHAVEEF